MSEKESKVSVLDCNKVVVAKYNINIVNMCRNGNREYRVNVIYIYLIHFLNSEEVFANCLQTINWMDLISNAVFCDPPCIETIESLSTM